jgi:hypothetical protein
MGLAALDPSYGLSVVHGKGRLSRETRGHVVPDETMRIAFDNLHFDGEIRTEWDVLLRIVGDITLWVRDRAIYREVEFPFVEFALHLANWFVMATDLGPDFVYTSLESETEGLIRFTRLSLGSWRVTAAYQHQEALDALTTEELKNAVLAYIRDLRGRLRPKVDILQYVENPKARKALQQRLGL